MGHAPAHSVDPGCRPWVSQRLNVLRGAGCARLRTNVLGPTMLAVTLGPLPNESGATARLPGYTDLRLNSAAPRSCDHWAADLCLGLRGEPSISGGLGYRQTEERLLCVAMLASVNAADACPPLGHAKL
jgi:hypothetical protein